MNDLLSATTMEKAAILLIDDDPASVHALMEYLHTLVSKQQSRPVVNEHSGKLNAVNRISFF